MGGLKPGVTAIIATLFEPPTLGPLCDQFKADGVPVIIIHGERTNVAWWHGLERVNTRHVMIANDDIEVTPKGFVPRLLAHHRRGFTHLLPTMWRAMNVVTPDGQGFTHGPGWTQPKLRYEIQPMDKGHFISLDRIIPVPPIPSELTVFYGDDWLYWWHKKKGRPALVTDVQVKSGGDLDQIQGFDGLSGYTQNHPDLDAVLGEPFRAIAEREHAAATKYFTFYRSEPIPGRWGWYGFSSGLKDESPALTKAAVPVPVTKGVNIEALLENLLHWDRGMIPPIRETLHRFIAYDGPLDTVVDIGAHWGLLSIVAAKMGAKKVIAVEGDPKNAEILRDNVAYMKLTDVIEVVEAAVGPTSGEKIPWGEIGNSGQRGSLFLPNEDGTTVETLAFTELLERFPHIDYCKIDVEGAEHTFMLDDERTMAALARIGWIDLEYHGCQSFPFALGAMPKEHEARTLAVMEKVGVPMKDWVSAGKVVVAA